MTASFCYLVQTFLTTCLSHERGLSQKTVASYSDSLRLLIEFFEKEKGISTDRIQMPMIDQNHVLLFLDYLTTKRKNGPSTRNQRLAVIKSFMAYASRKSPELLHQYECIKAINAKKAQSRPPNSLTIDHVKAILDAPDTQTLLGSRDHAMLLLFYNTGARVQEIADLSIGDINRQSGFIRVTGKGDKPRSIPLWEQTITAIDHYLCRRSDHRDNKEPLFLSVSENRLTRFGIGKMIKKHTATACRQCPDLADINITPHVFRHTTALHLIEADCDMTVVKDYLGHASIKTTNLYVQISIQRLRDALDKVPAPQPPDQLPAPIWTEPLLLDFLKKLSAPSRYVAHSVKQS